jgi:hypothetical protein
MWQLYLTLFKCCVNRVGMHPGALAYLSFLGFEKTTNPAGEQLTMNTANEHKRKTDVCVPPPYL